MTYRWVDHTAEVELHVEAPSAEQVFVEAAAALGELLAGDGGEPAQREVDLEARDLPTLLADWLEELVELADVDGFVPQRVPSLTLEGVRVRATVEGLRGEPRPLVKAVTYHGLRLEQDGDVWRARLVLDV